ncbi:VOC family protein [Bradyrhizobium sp. PMVTL-01]|uniref:VOC family protein n=1 Tax=Bradyrhizobium sp. PMVTL-01 TaxID=3434999 RepID=UPI003F6F4D96
MFSHLTVGTHDLVRAAAFYDAVLTPLGIERVPSKYPSWASWRRPGEAQTFWVGLPFNKLPAHQGNGWMAAFSASSRKAVDEAYAAAISAGAEDEGAPGLRPHFAPNYYGAYVRDLDGNKIHFVCREEEATDTANPA